MVMEASPTSSLEVPEPELLFQFLVVPLDAPAQLRERDEAVEGDVFRNGSKPELRGLLLLSWPFDQEPFLIPGNASIEVPVRGANTDTREARDQDVGAAFAPGNHLPGLGRERPSTDWGWWWGSRTMRLVGRPRPDQGLTAGDRVARLHTEGCGWTPGT